MWNIVSEPFWNAMFIFPTQQKDVYKLVEHYFTGFKQHKIVDLPACIVSSGSFRHFLAS